MIADVHSHILYGIDDGARNADETCSLLSRLKETGVTHLALTPHYYPYKESIESFLQRRGDAFDRLLRLPEAEGFTLTLGAEVYLHESLLNNEDLVPLCYRNTRYMLTELEYDSYFTDAARYRLLRLIEDFGVVPVLAHINRYPFLWKNLSLLEELKKRGCCFQVNVTSLKSFFARKQAIKLYRNGFLDFLGEDVHRSAMTSEEKRKLFSALSKSQKDFLQRVSGEAKSRLFV